MMRGGKIETESVEHALEDMTIKSKAFFLIIVCTPFQNPKIQIKQSIVELISSPVCKVVEYVPVMDMT